MNKYKTTKKATAETLKMKMNIHELKLRISKIDKTTLMHFKRKPLKYIDLLYRG